jgi:plastocyanin
MIRWSLGIALAVGILLALSPLAVASAVLPAGRAASGPPSLDAASAHAGARSQDRDAYDEDDRSGPGGGGDDGDDSSGHGGDDEDPVAVTGPVPTGSTVIAILDDDGYTPSTVTIDMGGTVTFVNQHHDEHTATGSAFDTGLIDPGMTASVTFDAPGTYAFGCIIHPEMTGTIGVRDADGVVPSPTPPPSAPPPAAALHEVAIIDFGFRPTESVVAVGTTVAWTVTQQSPHTVTASDGSFDSGILDVGGRFQHTFLEPGTFAYACRLHPEMQATIVVDPSLPAVSALPGSSATASPSAGP